MTARSRTNSDVTMTARSRTSSDVSEASVSFQSIGQWRDYGRLDALERVTSAAWRDRGYGDAWPYMLLAEGRLEFVAEFDVKRYDIAALIPIVREAGGEFTDIDGGDDLDALSSLATNSLNIAYSAALCVAAVLCGPISRRVAAVAAAAKSPLADPLLADEEEAGEVVTS